MAHDPTNHSTGHQQRLGTQERRLQDLGLPKLFLESTVEINIDQNGIASTVKIGGIDISQFISSVDIQVNTESSPTLIVVMRPQKLKVTGSMLTEGVQVIDPEDFDKEQ